MATMSVSNWGVVCRSWEHNYLVDALSSPLIHLPSLWDDTKSQLLQKEANSCFSGYDKSVRLTSLISVGGIECQDLPMSGNLKETDCLSNSPYLRYLLACITPRLGRVCLFKPVDTQIVQSPLYQNRAYPLFYQTLCLPLDKEILLIIEVKCSWLSLSDLYDTQRLNTVNKEALTASAKQTLRLTKPQLDILQPAQINFYISTALVSCKKYQKQPAYQDLEQACCAFVERWESTHSIFKNSYDGEWSYQSALNGFRQNVMPLMRELLSEMKDSDRQNVDNTLQMIDSQLHIFPVPPQRINRKLLLKARRRKQILVAQADDSKVFDRPIFIVSAPRAGSTLLFETLTQFSQIWSTGEENHALLENISGLHPNDHGFESNRLEKDDASEIVTESVRKAFISKLQNREQQYFLELTSNERPKSIRFLEKTPKNALRIPFLKTLFPDALFVYLQRDYKSNVSSLIDGWRSHQFVAYKDIPDFESRHWKFLLIPKWQELHNQSIANIAHQQWQQSNHTIQQDLSKLSGNCWMSIDYQDLISQPETVARQFADFAELDWDDVIQQRCENGLPVSRLTLSSPNASKWQKHRCFLEELNPNYLVMNELAFG